MICDNEPICEIKFETMEYTIKRQQAEIDSLKTAIIGAYRLIVMFTNKPDFKLSRENIMQIKQLLTEYGIDSDQI